MKTILLRPAEPERDFGQLAAWFSSLEDEPTTEPGLKEDYEAHRERIIRLMVAEDEQGELLGFNWAYRDRMVPDRVTFFLYVKPERRGQEVGGQLYEDLRKAAEEAQRKLYLLNDTTAAETPGSDSENPWASFEDFQKRVCQSDWYKPGGQIAVIDTATGDWAAMSAITRLEGNVYAYNLFTGVDQRYRGRKLGQAVKVTALRYAREVLKASSVHTHHNTKNLPMIAIDRKLGYTQMPGSFSMEKVLS